MCNDIFFYKKYIKAQACYNVITTFTNNTTNSTMPNHFDYEDTYKVMVDITLVNDENESRIEKRMQHECREGTYWDKGLVSYFKLNLKNASGISSVRTFFACTAQRERILVRYDKDGNLKKVGSYNRQRKFQIAQYPLPYSSEPVVASTIHLPPPPVPSKAYKMTINTDENLIPEHPFKESQVKFSYGYLNQYKKAFQKNEKLALRNLECKYELHDFTEAYDGKLLRLVAPDLVHYFAATQSGVSKTWNVSLDTTTELKRWAPKTHLGQLRKRARCE